MMLNSQEIVDDNMVVEGYEEIAVDDMNRLVPSGDGEEMTFEEDDVRSEDGDGYGGMPIDIYNDIVEYKRTGVVPNSVDKRLDRSAPSHWRARCTRFTMADDNVTLLYYNPLSPVNDQAKVVVKKGEVRRVLERIHELIGHLGQKRTQMVVLRKLYWRSVRQDVKNYIMSCDFCNQKKVEGRKIVKAPIDITSATFDIKVSVRDTSIHTGDRLELSLVGYNEQEVRDAAYTRMTSYTFKETASEFRSRYSLRDPPEPTFRRQPYVKRNGGQMAIGYLLPYQQRSRAMEPEFIEIYERQNMTFTEGDEGEEFEQVVEEIVEPINIENNEEQQIKDGRNSETAPIAHPVMLDGRILQGKKFFKEEEEDNEVVDVGRSGSNNPRKLKKENEAELPTRNQQSQNVQKSTRVTRYNGKRSVPVDHEEIFPVDEVGHEEVVIEERVGRVEPTTSRERVGATSTTSTANLVKKRRREGPSIHGMASRFSLAIGESERMDTNDNRNSHMIYEGSSSRSDLHGLPPVCMMPSLDPNVIEMQKEILQRQIRIQKMQEKLLQAQYDASMRIPITRYVQSDHEHHGQEESIEVEHELNVIDDHTVYQ